MNISLIAAIGQRRELGKDNALLWHIPEDMQRFRALTLHHPIIMGRKTFASIGRALPERLNIVLTQDATFEAKGCVVCNSLTEAFAIAQQSGADEAFVIGGECVYREAMPFANRVYLTQIEATDPDADVFFPDYSQFTSVKERKESHNDSLRYTFVTLESALNSSLKK